MEKRFEEEWRKAFEGAEVQPSEGAWQSMESSLIIQENQRMKRRVVFYQRLAAASVLFALGLGAFGLYSWKANSNLTSANKEVSTSPLNQQQRPIASGVIAPIAESKSSKSATATSSPSKSGVSTKQFAELQAMTYSSASFTGSKVVGIDRSSGQTTISADSASETTGREPISMTSPTVATITESVPIESPLKIRKKEESIIIPGLPENHAEKDSEEKKDYDERLWASLNVAGGSYNSGLLTPSYNTAPSLSAGTSTFSVGGSGFNKPTVGTSKSVGATIGKRISRRWVILTGVSYLSQSSELTSNSSSQGQAYVTSNFKAALSVSYANPYQVNNILEYVTVPVQAGYIIVDRKLGLQMNAGVATDFLVRNIVEDQTGQLDSYSQGAGSASPYRSVNWAGLVSTELSYRLAAQYRISLVPGIRYSIHPAFKSGAADRPYGADIGFRFRYILR